MGLNNVAMIMAPNLFLSPATPSKTKSIKELELSKAAGTSSIIKMLVHYQNELWTVSVSLLSDTKEGSVLFNDALNTFYLRLYGRKEMSYLMMHSTHFIYGYMEGRKCLI